MSAPVWGMGPDRSATWRKLKPYYVRRLWTIHGWRWGAFRAERRLANGSPYGKFIRSFSDLDTTMDYLLTRIG